MAKDYYQILGISRNASLDDIKKAFRTLAQKYHPDKNPGNKTAEEKFKDINEAYQVLSDPEKKEQYDRFGFVGRPGPEQGPGAGQGPGRYYYYSSGPGVQDFNFDINDLISGMGRRKGSRRKGFGGIGDLFSDIFGGQPFGEESGYSRMESGDIEAELPISFMDAMQGGTKTFQVNLPVPCSVCGGTGRMGKGYCPSCEGSGFQTRNENLTIRIPAGVRDQGKLRIPGKGRSLPGAKPGDLVLNIRVMPHPYFRREQNDIHLDLPITIFEAALGASVDTPTIDGRTSLKVPPGTQSGQILRMRGKGAPDPQTGRRGDQYVHIQIVIPEKLDEKSKKLLEEFGRLNAYNPRKKFF